MRLLAVDLGTKIGWSIWHDGEFVTIGTKNLKNKTTEKIEDVTRRLRGFTFLSDIIVSQSVTHVAVEGVNAATMRGNRQRELHYGDRGVLELICGMRGVPLVYIPVGTAKKRLTGSGNAKKHHMIAHATQVVGKTIDDDNAADSVGVALAAIDAINTMEKKTNAYRDHGPRRTRKNDGGKGARRLSAVQRGELRRPPQGSA
jgi:Holliday junction resolvasome RuvABC endonuclease subunit